MRRRLAHRIQASPIHRRFAPIDAQRTRLLAVGIGRREQQQVMFALRSADASEGGSRKDTKPYLRRAAASFPPERSVI
ncbi:hypothetical protein B1812_01335 [Methylocystis bryophila]|uniref:Uncharacterized protein n=1 Tax=Methylocystis bryophila TaxID=655015 RepID=A0A1W6MR24_9HYPH|nr:hypothetical protein B1812_01335 [Methylocystis bryophila]